MECDPCPPGALPTDAGPSHREYCTAIEPLLDQENQTSGNGSYENPTVAGDTSQSAFSDNTPAELPLHREIPLETISGWLTLLKPIRNPAYVKILDGVFRPLFTHLFDRLPRVRVGRTYTRLSFIVDYLRLTAMLLSAAEYVMFLDSRT